MKRNVIATKNISFWKYHGAGNDFIMLNGSQKGTLPRMSQNKISFWCDRQKGIGADGFIILLPKKGHAFEMRYYNSDGKPGSFCGNGSRCAVLFAYDQGISQDKALSFYASDGYHRARLASKGMVEVSMCNVNAIEKFGSNYYFLDTGSPHFVQLVRKPVDQIDMISEVKRLRKLPYLDSHESVNINFVYCKMDSLTIRTYERGVEAETLACGTGITAAALVSKRNLIGKHHVQVEALGGMLSVRFECFPQNVYKNIVMSGPAQRVFSGVLPV